MFEFSKLTAIALASTIKFVGGPLAGVFLKVSWWETALASTAGMMITITIITYAGDYIPLLVSKFRKPKKKRIFSRSIRFAVNVKKRLGLWGVAFLTPLIFTPILGGFLAIAFKFNKVEILYKMAICGLLWGALQTIFFQILQDYFQIAW